MRVFSFLHSFVSRPGRVGSALTVAKVFFPFWNGSENSVSQVLTVRFSTKQCYFLVSIVQYAPTKKFSCQYYFSRSVTSAKLNYRQPSYFLHPIYTRLKYFSISSIWNFYMFHVSSLGYPWTWKLRLPPLPLLAPGLQIRRRARNFFKSHGPYIGRVLIFHIFLHIISNIFLLVSFIFIYIFLL